MPIHVVRTNAILLALFACGIAKPASAAAPISFSGTGKQVTRQVSLPAGVHVVRMHHDGQRNFIVRPHSSDRSHYPTIANEIGPFRGSAVFVNDTERPYLFSVDADGRWFLSIEDPKHGPNNGMLKGHASEATDIITLAGGLYVFEMKHNGQNNFIVRPYSSAGRSFSTLANEIGPFRGSAAESFGAGDYLFNVDADGDWELTIRKQ